MSSYPTEKMHLTTSEIDGVSAELDNSIELEQTLSLPMSILVLNVCASLLDELSVGDILFTLTCKGVQCTDDFQRNLVDAN